MADTLTAVDDSEAGKTTYFHGEAPFAGILPVACFMRGKQEDCAMEPTRIVTRPDFDGIVCAVLLKDALGIAGPVFWIEPGAVQKKEAPIRVGDVVANLPYDPRCSLWFDHHYTNRIDTPFEGAFALTPSAARVVFEYFPGRFSRDFTELVVQTDRIDSADLTEEEVRHPERYPYVLLSMSVKNPDREAAYWDHLVDLLGAGGINEVMEDRMVRERCQRVVAQNLRYRELLRAHTAVRGPVSVTDFRSLEKSPGGNRFLVFSLFPDTVVNAKIHYHDRDRDKVVVHLGHSIFNRNCRVNVGKLLSAYQGGGHRGAGAAAFDRSEADRHIAEILSVLERNETNEADGP